MRYPTLVLVVAALLPGCAGGGGTVPDRATDGPVARYQQLYSSGRFTAAEEELRSAVARDASDMLARRLLGRVLLMRNQVKEATTHLAEAVRLSTDKRGLQDPMALQDYASALHRADEYNGLARIYFILGNAMLSTKYREMARIRPPYTSTFRGESATIGFLDRASLPVVNASVNGSVGTFVIDTTEGEIVLDNEFAKLTRVKVAGAPGSAVNEGFVDEVGLPGLSVRNVPVQIRNLKRLGSREINGIFGLSFLLHFIVTIDFKRDRLTLRPLGSRPEARGDDIPLLIANDSTLLVAAYIDGKDAHVALHLGMAGKQFVPAPILVEAKVKEVHVGPLRPVAAGDASLFPPGLDRTFGFPIGGILGVDAFRGRTVTLDFDAMRFTIE